jgi:LacI family transcriptional regulator
MAYRLKLAKSTVSRALAGSPQVGPATTARVRALAAELDYRPNVMAVSLRRGHSQTLGVVVPHLRNSFFPQLVQAIEEAANAAGYGLLICQSADDTARELQRLDLLRRAQVAGMLMSVASTTADSAPFEALSRQVPLVFVDRFLASSVVNAAVVDDLTGSYQATCHLLAQGYRRIAHLTGPQHLNIYRNRRLGYEQALHEAGLPVVPDLILPSALHVPDGKQAVRQLLSLPKPPDAIFSASDFAALGCLQALAACGIRVPEQMGVVGFSDEYFGQHTTPALSSVDQRAEVLGRRAVQLLLQLLKKPAAAPRHLIFPPVLRQRASSTRHGIV